jgi:hypothetical protein
VLDRYNREPLIRSQVHVSEEQAPVSHVMTRACLYPQDSTGVARHWDIASASHTNNSTGGVRGSRLQNILLL